MKRLFVCLALLWALPAQAQSPETNNAPLALEADDAAIDARLESLYGEIEGLSGVEVRVQSGVVTLSGQAGAPEAALHAENLARRLEGVVDVSNNVEVSADISERAQPALARLTDFYETAARDWPVWLAALAVFAAFWLLAVVLSRSRFVFDRLTPNPFVADLLRRAIGWALILAGLIAALDLAGAAGMMSAVIGAAGVAGLAIGFALKDTVANYIASTLLTLRRPFEANDIVRIGDQEGTVARLTPRSTILITTDGNHVSIPNGTVIQSVIVNFTRRPQRRFSFEVGIGAADDAGKACRITRDAIIATQGVIADPAPACIVKAFGNYNLILEASGWVDQRASSFLSVRGLAIAAVRDALLAQGIDLPDPIVQVRQLGEAAPAEAQPPQTATTDLQDMAEQQPESEAAEQAAREAEEGENLMKKAAPE